MLIKAKKNFSLASAVNDLRVTNGHHHTQCPNRPLTLQPVMMCIFGPKTQMLLVK